MKKNMIKYRIFLLIACVLFLTQTSTYAQNTTTEAQVEFTAGVGPTLPVDPEAPGTDVGTESVAGSLAIVSISNFNFGSISVAATAGSYNIQTVKPNIQVVDLRGSGTGWKVGAAVSKFKSGGSDSLPGASILIKSARPNSLSTSTAPVQLPNVRLTTDGTPTPLITAASKAGSGLWVMRWYPEGAGASIQLDIPAGSATVGLHTATISWTLEDSPSA